MWSHYADEHRGICIEYDMTDHMCPDIQNVDYRRPRSIKTSTLVDWKINKLLTAEKSLLDTFFFTKAPQWKYEREWRHLTPDSGAGVAPFRISGITFGLRCDDSVVTAAVKLHAKEDRSIRFYGLYPLDDSFRLKRRLIDTDEIQETGLRSSALLDFRNVFVAETDA